MQSTDLAITPLTGHADREVDERRAMAALHALSQRSRLLIFRMLVSHEPDGLAAGVIAQKMNAPQNSTSVHLAVLSRAELVTNTRLGRSVIYRAHMDGMRWLLNYLLKDCCNGDVESCAPLLAGFEKSLCSDPLSTTPTIQSNCLPI